MDVVAELEDAPAVPGYRVTGVLGHGAGGPVYAGATPQGDEVAIKVLPAGGEGSGLVPESLLAGRVVDEGVVRTYEVVPLSDGRMALVMALVGGGSLASVLGARARLSPGETVTVVSPVARTLGALHAAGLVHADVSPGNILLDVRGRPLLSDLGVARLSGEWGSEVFGTPGFAAPETMAGATPAPAADVYALGALAWFCLTGAPPGTLGMRVPLAELAPDLPDDLASVVHACLSPDPGDRPGAHDTALAFFDAVPPEPLRLKVGDDDVALLTRRLRAGALAAGVAAEPSTPPTPRPRGRTVLVGVTRPVIHLLHVVRRTLGRGVGRLGSGAIRSGAELGSRAWGSRRLAGAALALAAVAAVVAVLGHGGVSLPADAVPPRADSSSVPAAKTTPAGSIAAAINGDGPGDGPGDGQGDGSTAPAGGSAARREALRSDPQAVVQDLSNRRAAALVAADAQRLTAVDVSASEAWTADAAVIGRLQSDGLRYADLSFTVRTAELVRGGASPDTEPGTVVVRVEVDTGAYAVTEDGGGRGSTRTVPAVLGKPLDLHLTWTARGWRTTAVRPVG